MLVARTIEISKWHSTFQPPFQEENAQQTRLTISDPRNDSLQVFKADDRAPANNSASKSSACFNCRQPGHWASQCPNKQNTPTFQYSPSNSGQDVIFKGRLFPKHNNEKRSFSPTNPFINRHKNKIHLISDTDEVDASPLDPATALAEDATDDNYNLLLQTIEADQPSIFE
ncbi:hypothetical protein K3495_g13138 [Podosphaera aphanis]|nr:hypothetical protein K3495_g13138 [Podosphaera aphanis]